MIVWSIDAARRSGCFDRIVVSTDDQEIAEVAQRAGAEVPFMRPASLADDFTGTIPVIWHALQELSQDGSSIEHACCIYATAPFLRAENLKHGLDMLVQMRVDYAFSVTDYAFPIQRALRMNNGRVEMVHPEMFDVRSQDLEPRWHDAGQFYWGTWESWRTGKKFFSANSFGIHLPRHQVQDIDNSEDWHVAELLHQVAERSQQ